MNYCSGTLKANWSTEMGDNGYFNFLTMSQSYKKRPILMGVVAQVPELSWPSKELASELGSHSAAGTIIYQILLIKCPVSYSCISAG